MIWGLNIVLTLIPLSTNVYGTDDQRSGSTMCSLGGARKDSFIWRDVVFNGVGLVCILCMCFWIAEVAFLHRTGKIILDAAQLSILASMKYYPLGMMITWLPMLGWMIVKTSDVVSGKEEGMSMMIALAVCEVLLTQYGTVLGTVFFSQSHAARDVWTSLLCAQCRIRMNESESDEKDPTGDVDEGQWLPEVTRSVTFRSISVVWSQLNISAMFGCLLSRRKLTDQENEFEEGKTQSASAIPEVVPMQTSENVTKDAGEGHILFRKL